MGLKFTPLLFVLFIFYLSSTTLGVDRSNFKTCEQAGFCKLVSWHQRLTFFFINEFHRRHRAKKNNPPYNVQANSVKTNETAIEAILESSVNRLTLFLALLDDSRLRVLIDEIKPIRQRFHPVIALNGEPKHQKWANSIFRCYT